MRLYLLYHLPQAMVIGHAFIKERRFGQRLDDSNRPSCGYMGTDRCKSRYDCVCYR